MAQMKCLESNSVKLFPSEWRWSVLFHYIIVCIQMVVKRLPFDLPWMPTMMTFIAQRSPSGALNQDHYNSLDGQLGFTFFYNMNRLPIRACHVPLRVSKNRLLWLNPGIDGLTSRHVTCKEIKNINSLTLEKWRWCDQYIMANALRIISKNQYFLCF